MDKLEALHLQVRTNIVLNIPCSLETQTCPIWKLSQDGKFSTSSARKIVRSTKPVNSLFAHIWSPYISPTISIFWWKILQGWLSADCRMQSKGIVLASKCQCCRHMETMDHVILHNSEVNKAWQWFSNLLLVPCLSSIQSLADLVLGEDPQTLSKRSTLEVLYLCLWPGMLGRQGMTLSSGTKR